MIKTRFIELNKYEISIIYGNLCFTEKQFKRHLDFFYDQEIMGDESVYDHIDELSEKLEEIAHVKKLFEKKVWIRSKKTKKV